jgi:Tol biopolymer transport system component
VKRRRYWVALIGLSAGLLVSALVLFAWNQQRSRTRWPAVGSGGGQVADGRLLYLRQVDGRINLWLDQGLGSPVALSDEPLGVWDYSVTPDGRGILLAATAADGSDDIILIEVGNGRRTVLVECQAIACRQAHWQPNGHLVAYESHPQNGTPATVWILDTESGARWPAYDAQLLSQTIPSSGTSRFPRWSADGRYLSVFLPDLRVIVVLEPGQSEPHSLIPANLDLMGEWSPTTPALAYTELALAEPATLEGEREAAGQDDHDSGGLVGHLVVTDLGSGETADLSQGLAVNDGQPSWHPAGLGLAVSRTDTGAGRQLWFYSLESSTWQPLTNDQSFRYTAPAWSPDGRYLAFMRQAINAERPSVWLLDLEVGEMVEIRDGAFWPGWLP